MLGVKDELDIVLGFLHLDGEQRGIAILIDANDVVHPNFKCLVHGVFLLYFGSMFGTPEALDRKGKIVIDEF